MKNKLKNKFQKLLFLITVLLMSNSAFSQNCGAGDVYLGSQAQVDTFVATYSGTCDTIDGNLTIQYNLSDISVLSFLTTINGDLIIRFADLTTLTGLENITSIGGGLKIHYNDFLVNIDALLNLPSIVGDLTISNNNILPNVNGFSNLTSLGGSLNISSNELLENVDAFSNLTSIVGDLTINYSNSLISIDGFSNTTSIGSSLSIGYCPLIEDVDVFSNITSLAGNLFVDGNNLLIDINGFLNIISIGGDLRVSSNNILPNVGGFYNLTSIGASLTIQSNALLDDIYGLSNVSGVLSDELKILYNPLLTDISYLSNISAANSVQIAGNILVNLEGLENLTVIGMLSVQNEPNIINLNEVDLSIVNGSLYIINNASLSSLGNTSLNYLTQNITIQNNDVLTDITTLDNIQYVGGNVNLSDNILLNECCAVSNFFNGTSSLNGDLTISGNNIDCASLLLILDYCDTFEPNSDGDAIIDANDNCINTENPNQEDTDSDGIGDVCDNCPNDANASQEDANNNGIGDACEASGTGADTGSDIGGLGIGTTSPNSQFEVAKGDVFIKNIHRGIIMKSPSGNKCFRVQINEEGNFKSTEITCPDN